MRICKDANYDPIPLLHAPPLPCRPPLVQIAHPTESFAHDDRLIVSRDFISRSEQNSKTIYMAHIETTGAAPISTLYARFVY